MSAFHWLKVHRDCFLHLGNTCVHLGSPVIEGSENGEGRQAKADKLYTIWPLKGPSTNLSAAHTPLGRKAPTPSNQSSSCEGSGLSGLLTSRPKLTAVRVSMAVCSESRTAVAITPEGGILSSGGTPNEMLVAPWDESVKSPGNQTGHSLRKEKVCLAEKLLLSPSDLLEHQPAVL